MCRDAVRIDFSNRCARHCLPFLWFQSAWRGIQLAVYDKGYFKRQKTRATPRDRKCTTHGKVCEGSRAYDKRHWSGQPGRPPSTARSAKSCPLTWREMIFAS